MQHVGSGGGAGFMAASAPLILEVLTMRRAMWVTIAAAVATGAHAQGMRLLGRSDLEGAGLNGDVTVVGTKAVRIVQMAYP